MLKPTCEKPFVDRLLAHPSAVPALLSSAFAVSLLIGRIVWSGTTTYAFLGWNLFLAWLPYLVSLWAGRLHRRHPRRWGYLLVPAAVWLAFFPNAPYLITDLLHLHVHDSMPVWYDLGMLSAFALAGLFLAVFSLRIMQRLVREHAGPVLSWLFVGSSLGLGGLGIYLGRYLRWNSWDLLLNPQGVLGDVTVRLADPLSYPRTVGVTLLYAALLFVCYLVLTWREPA